MTAEFEGYWGDDCLILGSNVLWIQVSLRTKSVLLRMTVKIAGKLADSP